MTEDDYLNMLSPLMTKMAMSKSGNLKWRCQAADPKWVRVDEPAAGGRVQNGSMEFTPAELLLDVTNPRFEATASQREAINALLADREKMLALAADIGDKGMLNPAESPIVVEEDGARIVVEGNRRLACLKVLANPDLADDPKIRAAFERLAQRGPGPARIDVWVAPSRDAARHWIELRHTGQNGGVGVNPWTTEQQHRFDRKLGTQADRALTFTDGVAVAFAGDKEMTDALRQAKARSITTIGRVIADPDVRAAFGFDLHNGQLVFLYERAAIRRSLLRLLRDLAANTVGTFMSKEDRRDYTKDAVSDQPTKETRLAKPVQASELAPVTDSDDDERAGKGSPVESKPKSKMTKDERVIFETVKLKYVANRTKITLSEAQRVAIEDAPHVGAVMLRVILELVLSEAGQRYGWCAESDKLHQKVVKAIRILDPDCDNSSKCDRKLQPAYISSNTGKGGVAIVDLNQAVHNFSKVASSSDVRARSADFGPLLVAVDTYVGQNPVP
ncbi:hypothetical protein [Propioniciclava tarda]|uniref:ParB/Sulfiredoxin domain-containing protein n=1 Tax=Propioniciclava tarda TaxID=433330 RepID=A0A4Q9KNI4_PROTD|nr:hypothetical protein [Propioniciclava tarda]TBT96034.1 hypothetical protein ET996_03475 [Propioniciclava tarda]SMO43484.1 hypothetical protein SAMN06266982_102321 [Propioniciclava tarda]